MAMYTCQEINAKEKIVDRFNFVLYIYHFVKKKDKNVYDNILTVINGNYN